MSFEENLKKPRKPHRCNDRVEDVIEALFEGFGNYGETLVPAWKLMMKCFRSEQGDEPTDPYLFLSPKNPCYIDPATRKTKEQLKDPWK